MTPDELADARQGAGYDLAMTAARQRHRDVAAAAGRDAQFTFWPISRRGPSADVRLRPGDLLGSGTVGTGCLLEVRDATLGRYLEPGDEVDARHRAAGRAANPDRRATRLTGNVEAGSPQ